MLLSIAVATHRYSLHMEYTSQTDDDRSVGRRRRRSQSQIVSVLVRARYSHKAYLIRRLAFPFLFLPVLRPMFPIFAAFYLTLATGEPRS